MKYLSSNFEDWKSNNNVSLSKSQTNWLAVETEALEHILSFPSVNESEAKNKAVDATWPERLVTNQIKAPGKDT